jgi:dienelactone hydrolase
MTQTVGLRPELIPQHFRRQLRVVGIDDAMLANVLGGVRHLDDWPTAWEAEGDRHMQEGNHHFAAPCFYVAQRVLLTDSLLKQRLYDKCLRAYAQLPHDPPIERLSLTHGPNTIAGYLQVPHSNQPVPLVVMVPGITMAKEEMHPYAEPMLRRGVAVCRIDSPRYGETTGMLALGSERNPAAVAEHLSHDPRIDTDRIHLFGLSMGGVWALHSAATPTVARSVTTIATPFRPEEYLDELPTMNLTALQHMTGARNFDEVLAVAHAMNLDRVGASIEIPIRAYHGGRDRTVPPSELDRFAMSLSAPVSTQLFERDHHGCVEHLETIVGETLAWIDRD